MVDYTAPEYYPYTDLPDRTRPLKADAVNGMVAALADLGAADGRVTTLESTAALLRSDVDTVTPLALRPTMRVGVPTRAIVTAFGSGHGWTNTGGGTVSLNDTTDFGLGEQCITLTTTGGGDTGAARCEVTKTGITSFDATRKAIQVWIKVVSGMASLSSLKLFVGESSSAGSTMFT